MGLQPSREVTGLGCSASSLLAQIAKKYLEIQLIVQEQNQTRKYKSNVKHSTGTSKSTRPNNIFNNTSLV